MADELSVEDILAIEHDVIPLDGADVFQQGEIDSIPADGTLARGGLRGWEPIWRKPNTLQEWF